MVTTTTSPASAASVTVAARAPSPRFSTTSVSVSGPRLLLSTTWCPASSARRATVLPMLPLPINPHVVMGSSTRPREASFLGREGPRVLDADLDPAAQVLVGGHRVGVDPQPPRHLLAPHLEPPRALGFGRDELVGELGRAPQQQAALGARRHRHVAAHEEREPPEHAHLGHPAG